MLCRCCSVAVVVIVTPGSSGTHHTSPFRTEKRLSVRLPLPYKWLTVRSLGYRLRLQTTHKHTHSPMTRVSMQPDSNIIIMWLLVR